MDAPVVVAWEGQFILSNMWRVLQEKESCMLIKDLQIFRNFLILTGLDHQTAHQITGYLLLGIVILWEETSSRGKSKKQNEVAQFTTKYEYYAMAQTTCELVWIHNVLNKFGDETHATKDYGVTIN